MDCLFFNIIFPLFIMFSTYLKTQAFIIKPRTTFIQKFSLSVQSNILLVPFDEAERNEVKSLGGRWDSNRKIWLAPVGEQLEKFEKWSTVFLKSNFEDKDEIKALGAKYDPVSHKWYIKKDQIPKFSKWIDQNEENQQFSDKILVLDLHTSGFPRKGKNGSFAYTNLSSFENARMISLSLIYSDIHTFQEIERFDSIIDPKVQITNTEFHGITNEMAMSQGHDLEIVLNHLHQYLEKSKYIIAHNIEFDLAVLKSELYRLQKQDTLYLLKTKIPLCSMVLSKNILKIQNDLYPGYYKSPSLKEFVDFSLNEPYPENISYTTNIDLLLRGLQVLTSSKQLQIN